MARFEFRSTGAAINRSLQDALLKQEIQRRQDFLDGISVQSKLRAEARAENEARRAETLAKQQDADRTAGIYGPSADLNPEAAATLRAGGYQVEDRSTLPARTIAMPVTTAPVDPRQAAAELRQSIIERAENVRIAMGYGPTVKAQELPSQSYSRRAETYGEQLAREQREAAQAEKDEARTFRNDQAVADRTFRGEQAELNRQARAEESQADRELKQLIASMSQSQSAETRALGNELKRLQVQAASDKLDAQRTEREQAKNERAAGRASVRDLAQSLMNDPALGSITGAVEGRRDTFLQGANVDALRRYNQLVNMLSLEGRAKLKGQGAVSDFEGRMLASAMSALDRAAGPEAVKKHLQAIVSVFTDDAPQTGGNAGGRVRRYNPATGQLE
jgi:hypothetical protein